MKIIKKFKEMETKTFLKIWLVFTFFFLFFGAIVYPTYQSSKSYLNNENFAYKKNSGYYDPNTDEIFVLSNNTFIYKTIYNHELCHRYQHYNNKSFSGKKIILREAECYIKMWTYFLTDVDYPKNENNYKKIS